MPDDTRPNERGELPRGIHELADYAAHDLTELALIAATAPGGVRDRLVQIGTTMQRLALYVEAVVDEGGECAKRVIGRAQNYEETIQVRADDPGDVGEILLIILKENNAKRGAGHGPGEARKRNVGFRHEQGDGHAPDSRD